MEIKILRCTFHKKDKLDMAKIEKEDTKNIQKKRQSIEKNAS
jgi:hypothetical protein